jgi:hypothetical protein
LLFFPFLITPSWEAKQLRFLCFRKFKIPLVLFVGLFRERRIGWEDLGVCEDMAFMVESRW